MEICFCTFLFIILLNSTNNVTTQLRSIFLLNKFAVLLYYHNLQYYLNQADMTLFHILAIPNLSSILISLYCLKNAFLEK